MMNNYQFVIIDDQKCLYFLTVEAESKKEAEESLDKLLKYNVFIRCNPKGSNKYERLHKRFIYKISEYVKAGKRN